MGVQGNWGWWGLVGRGVVGGTLDERGRWGGRFGGRGYW